jgi:mannan endo-1,4-beta-mannosidase
MYYGDKLSSEGQFDIYFQYKADANRICKVSLIKSNIVYAISNQVAISAGSNNSIAVTLNRVASAASQITPIGSGYTLLIQFFTSSSLNIQSMSYSLTNLTVESGYQGFYTTTTPQQAKIYDANKNEFLMRGMSNAHAWFDSYSRWLAYNALPYIAQTGSNVVRIVWLASPQPGLVAADLEKIILLTIQLKMIPMLELHDATGSSDANYLNQMAQYWANNVWLLIKYRKYILVNICNEWSPFGTNLLFWLQSYSNAISIIRAAGFSGVLIVDASAYAQNPNGPITYGKQMIANDLANNLVFSVHMYSQWSVQQPDYSILNYMSLIKNASIPFIVGEFGYQTTVSSCSIYTIDAVSIMQQCYNLGFGYLGWSWSGNGQGDCGISLSFLDLASNSVWNTTSYSTWGNILFNTASYGIKATSKLATIF